MFKWTGMATRVLAALAFIMGAGSGCAESVDDFFPKAADKFSGNYVGRWSAGEDVDPDIAAQVIALGKGEYHIVITSKLHMRAAHKLDIDVKEKDGKLHIEGEGLLGDCDGETFNGGRKGTDRTFAMKRWYAAPESMGKPAPEGAVVLFDGKDLSAWDGTEGWQVLPEGILLATPKSKYLTSKQLVKDCQLHIEFRTPFMPTFRGQGRGNSGVFIQGEFECQVLDTFGLEGWYDECGALYKVAPPRVNACLPPLEWQVYDITYHAPQFDATGKQTAFARMTVYQNGILIHHEQELPQLTSWKEKERLAPHPKEPGPIKLQGHGNYVQYRNIWVKPL